MLQSCNRAATALQQRCNSEEEAAMLAAGKRCSAADEVTFNQQNRKTADILAAPAKRFGESCNRAATET
jgi:hypothetical protein